MPFGLPMDKQVFWRSTPGSAPRWPHNSGTIFPGPSSSHDAYGRCGQRGRRGARLPVRRRAGGRALSRVVGDVRFGHLAAQPGRSDLDAALFVLTLVASSACWRAGSCDRCWPSSSPPPRDTWAH